MPRDYRLALRPESDQPDETLMDDVVVKDVSMFRAEMMSDKSLWLCCYLAGTDERVTFWASVKRGKLVLHVTEYPMGDFAYEDDDEPAAKGDSGVDGGPDALA